MFTASFLYFQCIRIFKIRRDESIWTHFNFCEFSWKCNFWKFSKILKIKNFKIWKFSFSIKLRSVVFLRVLKLWQWSNNVKVSIFIEEYDFHIFIGARALPRALRAMPDTIKMSILATFQSTWCCARDILARANGYKIKKLNLFYIYNVFVSSKLAEIQAFEVLSNVSRKSHFLDTFQK